MTVSEFSFFLYSSNSVKYAPTSTNTRCLQEILINNTIYICKHIDAYITTRIVNFFNVFLLSNTDVEMSKRY